MCRHHEARTNSRVGSLGYLLTLDLDSLEGKSLTACKKNPTFCVSSGLIRVSKFARFKIYFRNTCCFISWHGRCSEASTRIGNLDLNQVNEGMASMHKRKQINTTLGDLIVAVSDAVYPLANNTANADILVSYILNDLIVSRRVRLKKGSVLKAA